MGQLNNLYVSSSYQGLLKMTDSTNGLTNTLQTVQTGDGDNSPLQMSLTQVNISGSFTINGNVISGSTSGSSGTSGNSGTSGSNGSSGTSGSSGIGYTYRGEWTGTTNYNQYDTVSYGGQTYMALSSNINKQPSVWPAIWQLFSAAGSNGTSGTSGSNGSSGSNGTDGSSGTSGSNGSSGSSGSNGTNGSSGSSGSNGTDGSSGSSGSNGTNGSSGTSGSNGTNGSSGSNGTDGSSGTSGVALGLPAKNFVKYASDYTYTNLPGTGSWSQTSITFATPFTTDYSVDYIYSLYGDSPNNVWGTSSLYNDWFAQFAPEIGNKTSSGFTITIPTADIPNDIQYTGFTSYIQAVGLGSSNGSGLDGSSGTSGSNGSSGTSGSNGSSGTSGSNGTNGSSGSSGTSGQNGISAGRTYYFNQSQTSDVAGYKILSETPTTGTTQTVTTNLTGNQQNVLVQSYITPQLGFNIIPAGVQRFHLHLLKPASNDDIDVYVTLQLANSTGGTIGSLITSSANIITWNSGNPSEVYVDIVFSSTVIDPTNRMIVKIYLNNNESSAMSVDFDTEGNEYSYVITSVGVVAGTSGTSGTNGTSGTSATGGGGSSVIQVTGVTLASGSWSLSSSLYIYDYSNTGITTGSSVMVIPSNDSVQTIINAQVLPTTLSTSGSVRLYSTYQPAANIGATINITETTIQ